MYYMVSRGRPIMGLYVTLCTQDMAPRCVLPRPKLDVQQKSTCRPASISVKSERGVPARFANPTTASYGGLMSTRLSCGCCTHEHEGHYCSLCQARDMCPQGNSRQLGWEEILDNCPWFSGSLEPDSPSLSSHPGTGICACAHRAEKRRTHGNMARQHPSAQ